VYVSIYLQLSAQTIDGRWYACYISRQLPTVDITSCTYVQTVYRDEPCTFWTVATIVADLNVVHRSSMTCARFNIEQVEITLLPPGLLRRRSQRREGLFKRSIVI
jgi:hypothetical protein